MKTRIIEQYIIDEIQKNTLTNKIETEDQLSKRFSVSKITVRGAISNLVNQGILRKVQGSGVYVAPKNEQKIQINVDAASFRERAKKENKKAATKVLTFKKIDASVYVQQKMNLQPEDTVYYYERINFFDTQAMAYEQGYIKCAVFPYLCKKDLENSKFGYFRAQKVEISHIEKIYHPMVASTEIVEALKIQGKAPLIAVENFAYTSAGDIVDLTMTYYNPDKFYMKNIQQISPLT